MDRSRLTFVTLVSNDSCSCYLGLIPPFLTPSFLQTVLYNWQLLINGGPM